MTQNNDSISIECCHVSDEGSFTQETYDTLVHTLAWLIDKYDLTADDILRHYDCGGKKCPKYYVEHIARKHCCNISVIIAFKKRVAFLTDIFFFFYQRRVNEYPALLFIGKRPFGYKPLYQGLYWDSIL